nr:methane monooxygenase/ammonia monooxygenase subunit C [Methylocapsa acidiphila]
MTLISDTTQRPTTAIVSVDRPIADLRPLWIAGAVICAFYVGVRLYEQAFGWYAGLDSFSPEFQKYWTRVLYILAPTALVAFLGLIGYLWKTRPDDLATVAPREELRRIFYLLNWILIYGLAIYWGASYFSEQDATWHQSVIRDSAFTPLNIIKFYVSYPIYIIAGVGGFMYARTRLPTFANKGYSIAYALFFIGPLMCLPGAALSEWGCTFWYMEELFVAPLHWTFVFFGWFALALFGVSLQILGRIRELLADDESFLPQWLKTVSPETASPAE